MKRYLQLFKEAWNEFSKDKAQRLGASLAYYTLFSIAPLLLIAIAIAGLIFGRSQAQAQIIGQLRTLMGDSGAKAIGEMLVSAGKPKTGALAIVIGALTLLFGAAGVFGQLKDALNTIWNVEEKPQGGILGFIKQRFLSFAMVLCVGFLLLVSLVLDAALSAFGSALWQPVQLLVSFAVVTVMFAMIFRYLPDVRVEWRDVWVGAAFTSLLFVLGKFGLGLYLGKSAIGSSYGAAGSLVVLLVWIYWSANILFFGAEITQVYARQHRVVAGAPARPSEAEAAAATQKRAASAGFVKFALGTLTGLLLGIIAAIAGAIVLGIKSVKKLLGATIR
ncbi:MAG: YihY/virulence factor BrkB family protein [Acidobacteriota bacterium]|nr:YihY/virulence factor BrkB family protein [Acidobacteriota bacterium]